MLCPADSMQMHQKARVGDGETNDIVHSTWMLLECPLCGMLVVEFYSAVMVESTEQARIIGGMLIARTAEAAV